MYNTAIMRMLCVLDGYLEIIASYQRNLVMDINQNFHLARQESSVYIRRNPDSLHNLKYESTKAHQIITRMKDTLKSGSIVRKDIHSLESILRQDVSDFYYNDSDALLFGELVISRIIELAADDEQFSEFSLF